MLYKIKRIYQKLSRIIRFIPKLWKYELWEEHYIYDIWADILTENVNYWANPNNIVLTEKRRIITHRDLLICRNLLKRLSKEEYCDFEQSRLPKCEWIWEELSDRPSFQKLTFKFGNEYDEYVNGVMIKVLHKKKEDLIKNDLELFAKIFVRNSRSWWD